MLCTSAACLSTLTALPLFKAAWIDKCSASHFISFWSDIKKETMKAMVTMGITCMMTRGESMITKEISATASELKVTQPGSWTCCQPSQSTVLGQGEQHHAVHRPFHEGCSYLWALHAPSHHRERPTQALLGVGNRAQGMLGHQVQEALATEKATEKKNEGSWEKKKKRRRELGVSRMREKMGKQSLQGCVHNATTLLIPVLYFVLI